MFPVVAEVDSYDLWLFKIIDCGLNLLLALRPPALSLSLSLTLSIIGRRSVCRGYTNKDNLKRQQSITAALKVTAAPSAASARHRRAPSLPFFFFLFNLFLLQETKGRRLFPLARVCVVPRRKERKKSMVGWRPPLTAAAMPAISGMN